MFLVLFGVGLLITAAGFLTIGFGIPINAFSLGNTLIISGTVAVVGGLVLIGLAAAVRQLNRVVEAINARPVAPRIAAPVAAAAAAEPSESLVPPTARIPQPQRAPAAAPMPLPPKPAEAAMPRPPEPRVAAPAAEKSSGPLEWLRLKPKNDAPSIAPESPAIDEEAPIAPRAPQRPMFSPPPFAERPAEPKAWTPPSRDEAPAGHAPKEPRIEIPPRAEHVTRVAPHVERTIERPKEAAKEAPKPANKDAGLFDVVWPDARSKPMPGGEQREPKFEPPRSREEPRIEKRSEPAPAASAILKSGVIDGMAYTLYADGSIEAELPQGVVKFASVDALRAHLEKSA